MGSGDPSHRDFPGGGSGLVTSSGSVRYCKCRAYGTLPHERKVRSKEKVYVKLHQFFSILETYVKLVKTSLPKVGLGTSVNDMYGEYFASLVSKTEYAICEKGWVPVATSLT